MTATTTAPTADDLDWFRAQVDGTADDSCPEECGGTVVLGTYEADTGHQNASCSKRCGWSA